ncbi:MAG: hypothetical protein EON60_10595 [Alphaproteobacteria bacterium]|nr:MAG: hypothetical protein EON60_10595 [Alphaproteobacteria bacterium]
MDASVNPNNLHTCGPPVLTRDEYLRCEPIFDFGTRHVTPEDLTLQFLKLVRQANGTDGSELEKETLEFIHDHLQAANKKEASYALRVLARLGLSRSARNNLRKAGG